MVRIRGFHPRDPGSSPGVGTSLLHFVTILAHFSRHQYIGQHAALAPAGDLLDYTLRDSHHPHPQTGTRSWIKLGCHQPEYRVHGSSTPFTVTVNWVSVAPA